MPSPIALDAATKALPAQPKAAFLPLHQQFPEHRPHRVQGKRAALWCSICQALTLFLVDIAWAITGAVTAQDIARQYVDADSGAWYNKIWVMALLFGAVELLLSQVRNLEEAWWVSAVGTVCSLIYSAIAFVLAATLAHARGGSVAGIAAAPVDKALSVLGALGVLAFGFSGGQVLLEIEHTLRQPPSPTGQMQRVANIAMTAAFLFYCAVAFTGYAAFGNGGLCRLKHFYISILVMLYEWYRIAKHLSY